jgi:GNAT superfamily N-acetyltransferase
VRIRLARARDRSGLLALWLDLVQHHRRLDPDYPALPGIRELLLGEITRGLRRKTCQLGIAEQGDEPVGFIFAEVTGAEMPPSLASPVAWIHELYVDPAWRSQGVGSALVELADAFFCERGARSASVRVEIANEEGLRFWSGRGFGERARILTRE